MNIFPLNTMNQYNSLHGLPPFVKEAAVVTSEDVKKLPQTAFADPRRKLPVHNKVATWCSYLSFYAGAIEDDTKVAGVKLEKAAAFWGIGAECREILANIKRANTQRPLTDDDFAIVSDNNGEKIRRFPIAGPDNIMKSASELVQTFNRYPLPWRKRAAGRILKRAGDLSVQLVNEHQLQQMAGIGLSKAAEILPHLRMRVKFVKDAEIRKRFEALADEVEKVDSLDTETLAKMAEIIDIADRAAGIYQYYGRGIFPPEVVCHLHTLQEVSEKRAGIIALTNGQGVNKEALAKLSADRFVLLGDDFVAAITGADGNVDVEQAAVILPTLPVDDANLLINSL